MRYATPDLRRAAMRLLAHEAGGDGATSEQLAAASARVLDRLSEHLTQIIGRVGMEALWLRTVKLRRPEFPFLDERVLARENARPGEPIRACLQGQEPDVVREASVVLFATVAGLLVTVIGDRPAWSLLQSAWPDTLRREADPEETEE
jgi:hypothetical protein